VLPLRLSERFPGRQQRLSELELFRLMQVSADPANKQLTRFIWLFFGLISLLQALMLVTLQLLDHDPR
jgi:hypothetical protein